MLKKKLLLISSFYSLVLASLSLIKLNDTLPPIKNSDKLYHVIAYFIFMTLWYYTFLYRFKLKKTKALVIAFIASISFGVIMEILQGVLTENRQSDINDVVANTIGAILALLMLVLIKKRDVKYSKHL